MLIIFGKVVWDMENDIAIVEGTDDLFDIGERTF